MTTAILGISAFYHDSAAALLVDGRIRGAVQEERFSRRKHDPGFPAQAIRYLLDDSGLGLGDLAAIVFYEKPYLKFERLLETYHAFAPRGLASFAAAMPVWVKEKLFARHLLWQELEAVAALPANGRPPLLFPEHHVSHAAAAFYPSPFPEAAILTMDGVGEWATTTIGHGRGQEITLLRELPFPHSLGLVYSAFTLYCGFKVNSGEYKLMGLAPYGRPDSERTRRFCRQIMDELIDLRPDGSLLLNMDYFDFATGLSMCQDERWRRLFDLQRRQPEGELAPAYMDLACAVQQVTEEAVLRLAATATRLAGCRRLVLGGGVALNCVANGRLLASGLVDRLWIQPAAGDAGGALGAAYAGWHIWQGAERPATAGGDAMAGSYLGPDSSNRDVAKCAARLHAPYEEYADFGELCRKVAGELAAGKVVGWLQGRMEWGPRALGNRSILADPRQEGMQKKLNLKIKFREGFRPFAPAVLAEEAEKLFQLPEPSPYMLLVAPVAEAVRRPVPALGEEADLASRLYQQRSLIPAVTHVDYSARVQTVHRETNPRFWQLIDAFRQETGLGALVNTSFNVRGEPMVMGPEDAYRCFMRTGMDLLVMNDCLFDKADQPPWPESDDWRRTLPPD
ncbi:MAG: carbamoyltransferase [Thermodesulfobacteriota bacterium]